MIAVRRRYNPCLKDVPPLVLLATVSMWGVHARKSLMPHMERKLLKLHRRFGQHKPCELEETQVSRLTGCGGSLVYVARDENPLLTLRQQPYTLFQLHKC